MEVKRFVCNPFQEITYVLFDESKEAVIIDCGCFDAKEQQRIVDFLERKELSPVKVLNTHLHIDHIIGNSFLFEKYGLSPMANEGDKPLYEQTPEQAKMFGFPMDKMPPALGETLNEGDTVCFGNSTLKVYQVPGHSPGSICFHNSEEGIIFVGDVIFERSIGRTDLWGGDTETLINGIKQKILTLPPETVIAPGHGSLTTVGDEKNYNTFLK